MRRSLPLLALMLLAHGVPGAAAAADPCQAGGPQASFMGVVYDAEQRDDFQLDVDNFEHFLSRLRSTYCIPSSRSAMLAMEDGYTRNGKRYDAASETAVKQRLRTLGPATPAGATFFFMLTSHGIAYAGAVCPGGRRALGSLAALLADGSNDGDLLDCELGAELNERFRPSVRMAVLVDCSFCGGFSDSLTAVSGTVPDGSLPVPSGIVAPGRVVITGCAITTECFGGTQGAELYGHMRATMSTAACDGWTAPRFPQVQGLALPSRSAPRDGRCGASEWLFAAVNSAIATRDYISIQQQFRIKYGFATLAEDIRVT